MWHIIILTLTCKLCSLWPVTNIVSTNYLLEYRKDNWWIWIAISGKFFFLDEERSEYNYLLCHINWLGFSQVNYLGPMLLSLELLPILQDTGTQSKDARIIFLSSSANHDAQPFNIDTIKPKEEEGYKGLAQYSNTKLYSVSLYT